MAVRRHIKSCIITGYDISPAVQKTALRRGALQHAARTVEECVEGADLIVIATPLGTVSLIFQRLARVLTPESVVTDVCSTKRSIVGLAAAILPNAGRRFVGAHPMFGSENSGIDHADANLLAGSRCILTPTARTDRAALRTVDAFWSALGLQTLTMAPAKHDQLLARASHLPQVMASVLMAGQDARSMQVSGRGLLDTTRLAASNPALWAEILTDNGDNLSKELRAAAATLTKLAAAAETGDRRKVKSIINAGRVARESLLKMRSRKTKQ